MISLLIVIISDITRTGKDLAPGIVRYCQKYRHIFLTITISLISPIFLVWCKFSHGQLSQKSHQILKKNLKLTHT